MATAAVEREHELAPEALAQRVLSDKTLRLRNDVGGATECEVGIDPLLERLEAELLKPCDLDLGPRLEREFRERGAAPQRERLSQRRRRSQGRLGPGFDEEILEPVHVDRLRTCS